MSEEQHINEEEQGQENLPEGQDDQVHVIPVSGMYEDWFLDYASYVILERAVPAIEDGLKPVQRRILHAMKEMDDGRFHKVANVIGQTMQYHPHGDAAIGDALVNLGQKELLIDTQGNWGDYRTGDSAAASRYIEAKLSKFALEVVFNPDTTKWQLSYDGRKKEPVTLPVKFPLLLAQGVEGIAVGLATKIMPHNFNELIDASIDVLKGKKIKLLPDFPTGGMADFSEYNGGIKGSRIRVRARIEAKDKKTLVIKDIPYGTTTSSLIDSIIKANDKNKIKIKSVADNTAQDVEIEVEIPSGVSPDVTIDALYAFTDCEVGISPNTCVIIEEKPHFVTVGDVLTISTQKTLDLLKQELDIRKAELLEKILFSSLEKIFIENRIYHDIEECDTWEAVIKTIDKGLDPFKKEFYREITVEDIVKLTEIKIKRISKFDSFKADELMKKLQDEMKEVEHHLKNLTDYAIQYFKNLKEKYGKGRERKTEIRSFDTIEVSQVAVANQKLYVDRAEGFVGYGLKKAEYVTECSDIDDIIVFRADGKFLVTRVEDKTFVGKDIIHADVWKKNNERMVYNVVYWDAKSKRTYAKRFTVTSITRDKEYDLTKGAKGSKVLYFTANPNGEAEVISVKLTQGSKARKKVFEFGFAEQAIKGRGAQGNILTRHPVRKVEQKSAGESTLGGLKIWLDDSIGRLNTDERGIYLGEFEGNDQILVIFKDGTYELTSYELTNRYEMNDIELIEKFNAEKIITALYYESAKKAYYVKRFLIETSSTGQRFSFISEEKGSYILFITTHQKPVIEYRTQDKPKEERTSRTTNLTEFEEVKGWKALGRKLSNYRVSSISQLNTEDMPVDDLKSAGAANKEKSIEKQKDESDKEVKIVKEKGAEEDLDIGTAVEWDLESNGKGPKKPTTASQKSLFD